MLAQLPREAALAAARVRVLSAEARTSGALAPVARTTATRMVCAFWARAGASASQPVDLSHRLHAASRARIASLVVI